MGSKLDQDPSSVFFHEDQTNDICVILQINRHEFQIPKYLLTGGCRPKNKEVANNIFLKT